MARNRFLAGTVALTTALAAVPLVGMGIAAADGEGGGGGGGGGGATPGALTGVAEDDVWYLGTTYQLTYAPAETPAESGAWALVVRNGETKVATIASGADLVTDADQTFTWTIPSSAKALVSADAEYTVSLESTATTGGFTAISDADTFKINAPAIDTVAGAEVEEDAGIAQGGGLKVTWDNKGITAPTVDIGLVDGTGKKKVVLAKATANDESETVTIPIKTAAGEWSVTVTPSLKFVTAGTSASEITVAAFAKPGVVVDEESVVRGGSISVTVAAASKASPVDVALKNSAGKVVATIAKKLTDPDEFTYALSAKLPAGEDYTVEASLTGVKDSAGTPASLDITAPNVPTATVTTMVEDTANQGEFIKVDVTSPSELNSIALVDSNGKATKLLSKVPAGTYWLEIPLKAKVGTGYVISVTNDTLKKGDTGLTGESDAFAIVANTTTLGSR